MSKTVETRLTLTRYLYITDEVKYSLLLSLIYKKDINSVLFWTYELYYSGREEELFQYIRTIYFDFYAIKTPKFYTFIDKQYVLWSDTKNDTIPGFILKNMFMLPISYSVFTLRQYALTGGVCKHVYNRGRKPAWINSYKDTYHTILRALHKKSYIDVYYYICKLKDEDVKGCMFEVGKYFENELHMDIDKEFYEAYEDDYSNMTHHDVKQVWISTILNLMQYESCTHHKKLLLITLTENEIKQFTDTETAVCTPLYKTLGIKRLYKIHDNIGYFKLKRNDLILSEDYNLVDEIQHHWLYYAYHTPRYKNILDKYEEISIDHIKREIVFKDDDDDFEDFYENYGYFEPDEQSTETIQKVFKYNSDNIDINSFVKDNTLGISFTPSQRFIY